METSSQLGWCIPHVESRTTDRVSYITFHFASTLLALSEELCQEPTFTCLFYFCTQPGYWGLSDSSFGCAACECDIGGSYERNCEQVTGQCRCRKGITGRKCDQVQTGNFFPLPDHLKYESEEAKVVGVCRPLNN